MYSEEEAKEAYQAGETLSEEPFIFGHIDISQHLLDALEHLKWSAAQILVSDHEAIPDENGKYPLIAKKDDGRKSSVCRMDKSTNAAFWKLWQQAADKYAPQWFDRFPQYSDAWFPGENGQIIKYSEGDFFKIHNDGGNFNYDFKVKGRDVCRGLMVIVSLSNAEDYEGGELHFPCMGSKGEFKFSMGDVLCFPAPMNHLVTELTKGNRYIILGQYYVPFHQTHRDLFIDQFDRG